MRRMDLGARRIRVEAMAGPVDRSLEDDVAQDRRWLDWIVALARSHRRRLMVRLVKGAYWDSEIKRAQVDGHADYPVFTRKVHTDVAYLACAKAMLAAPEAIYPQFASHNAFTVAAIHVLAGETLLTERRGHATELAAGALTVSVVV